ncbi:hypothetical protein DSM106972_036390 [Dulcicalothrix desertica PCC 7102]|uniref:Uncharacterized protein n=1 Tax=Dulcicalothrix desertica PCC 7102 TaxID=232991 RepID=A0A433VHR0_9CYAN|nr:hypothetical protein [Dulcicalothrix desertica]RUT05632.1 hypothetical protein DSM106972_036390 [Dulcicalothrix desertica PCC 7102]TWH54730.1 hypothetical protein CAL7102_02785 [Dulcicalothrix desertica PCC 7102]
MSESQPPLPKPQLEPSGITSEQYLEFTPEKLEFYDGYLGYGCQEQTAFQLAVLTNMGLIKALQHTKSSLWIEVLEYYLQEKLETINNEPEVKEAMFNRLNRALYDLRVVAEFLESENN